MKNELPSKGTLLTEESDVTLQEFIKARIYASTTRSNISWLGEIFSGQNG